MKVNALLFPPLSQPRSPAGLGRSVHGNLGGPGREFFNSVGPGRWSGQSGKELVLAAPFLHPEMERQAMEVGRSVSGGFSDTEQQRGSKFRAQSSG